MRNSLSYSENNILEVRVSSFFRLVTSLSIELLLSFKCLNYSSSILKASTSRLSYLFYSSSNFFLSSKGDTIEPFDQSIIVADNIGS
jgi:hypothetical protein